MTNPKDYFVLGTLITPEINNIKPHGTVLNAQFIAQLTTYFKNEFKNVDVMELITSPDFLENILAKIKTCIVHLDNPDNLELKDDTLSIVKGLAPSLSEDLKKIIANLIEYIIKKELVKHVPKVFFKKS